MRKTKIICTLGPASSKREVIRELALAGMNVARFNFSHGTHATHYALFQELQYVRNELARPIAAILDTKGPEIRIGDFKDGKIFLNEGDTFVLTTREVQGDAGIVSVTYKDLPQDLGDKSRILLDDGLIELAIESMTDTDVVCRVVSGGELSSRKGINLPGTHISMPYISEHDKEDILFGIRTGFDYIAASFVRSKDDVLELRKLLDENGGEHVNIMSKIENPDGVKNIHEIIELSDAIMVARGDMGVEIPFEQLPAIQKHLINACRLIGKRVITATEMLESMIQNPRPTRAEISDVANAVYDGTSAIMLSGETAVGKYPLLTLQTMDRIAGETEKNIHYDKRFGNMEFTIRDMTDAVSHAACSLAMDIQAKVIVSCTISGITARMISRFRPPIDIMALTPYETTRRKLALSWGVTPLIATEMNATDELLDMAQRVAVEQCGLQSGDRIVITGGMTNAISGNTNVLKTACI